MGDWDINDPPSFKRIAETAEKLSTRAKRGKPVLSPAVYKFSWSMFMRELGFMREVVY